MLIVNRIKGEKDLKFDHLKFSMGRPGQLQSVNDLKIAFTS